MTSGRKAERIANAVVAMLCAWLLAVAFSPPVHGDLSNTLTLPELMRALSAVNETGGRFTERKYLSILNEPLTLQGRVHYRAPDYVRKEFDDPDSENFEVRGDELTIEFPDGRRRDLSIDEHPVLRAFVESYRATLAGDEDTLKRYFLVELAGSMNAWELRLTPRQAELADYLSAVIMRGRNSTVDSVETLEASGDRSIMTLDDPRE